MRSSRRTQNLQLNQSNSFTSQSRVYAINARTSGRRLTNSYLSSIQDLRRVPDVIQQQNPSSIQRSVRAGRAKIVYRPRAISHPVPMQRLYPLLQPHFLHPQTAITCIRRKVRRSVLFALSVGGQGGRKASPRWNWSSHIHC